MSQGLVVVSSVLRVRVRAASACLCFVCVSQLKSRLFFPHQPHLHVYFFFLNFPPLGRWFIPRGLRWCCASRATVATRTATGLTSSPHAPTDTLPRALAKFSCHSLLAHTSSEPLSLPRSSLPFLLPVLCLSWIHFVT